LCVDTLIGDINSSQNAKLFKVEKQLISQHLGVRNLMISVKGDGDSLLLGSPHFLLENAAFNSVV
jgi:hypothetical protein